MSGETKAIVEAAEEVGSTLSSLIPQLFFDLIARIIPGFVIMALFDMSVPYQWYIGQGKYRLIDSLMSTGGLSFFFVIACLYIISVIFFGIWKLFVSLHKTVKLLFSKDRKKDNTQYVGILEDDNSDDRYNFIKLNAPIAGSRITKLKAEVHMSGTLASAFVTFFVTLLVVSLLNDSLPDMGALIVMAMGAVGCIGAYSHFTEHLYHSIHSYSNLLNYDDRLKGRRLARD